MFGGLVVRGLQGFGPKGLGAWRIRGFRAPCSKGIFEVSCVLQGDLDSYRSCIPS